MEDKLRYLHEEIFRIYSEEYDANPVSYSKGLPYQRYDRIKLKGKRWTPEKRIKDYGIDKYVSYRGSILDIGCNTGFMIIELAYMYKTGICHGIELNPYLCRIGELVAGYLGVEDKIRFFECKFEDYKDCKIDNGYDLILSLAAFYTADGRERESAESYFHRCKTLLKTGGFIIYESVSYDKNAKDVHYVKAKEAVRAMDSIFNKVESTVKLSGSPGWVREYFIGEKR